MTSNNGDTNIVAVLANKGIAIFPHWWVRDHLTKCKMKEVAFDGCF